jgi:hypothetical protein
MVALGSPLVPSYDSKGYGGGIRAVTSSYNSRRTKEEALLLHCYYHGHVKYVKAFAFPLHSRDCFY